MRKTALVLVVLASACISTASTEPVTVTDIVDGDTMDIRYENGRTDRLRLIGVDTPEVNVEAQPEDFEDVPNNEAGRECLREWGDKAKEYAEDLDGENMTLRQDPVQDLRGDYGRLLGYLEFNNSSDSFNYMLVEEGYARVYVSRFEEKQRFLEAETEAREKNKGIWECTDP